MTSSTTTASCCSISNATRTDGNLENPTNETLTAANGFPSVDDQYGVTWQLMILENIAETFLLHRNDISLQEDCNTEDETKLNEIINIIDAAIDILDWNEDWSQFSEATNSSSSLPRYFSDE